MNKRIDLTSVAVGCVLAGVLCCVLGAARSSECCNGGRFRIACTDSHAYLVDVVTGQVWNSQRGGDFYKRKLGRAGYPARRFAGEWRSDKAERDMIVWLESDGNAAVLYDGVTLREGQWRAIHGHVFIDPMGYSMAEKMTDGRTTLLLKGSGREAETTVFRKVE